MTLAVSRTFILLATLGTLTTSAICQTWEREDVGFESIQSRARDLANKPYVAPNRDSLPAWMNNLTYDQYRDIRFNPNQALWAADKLPFRAMFFHPGYLFREPVMLNEFTGTHQQQIRLAEAFFNYGPLINKHGDLPADGGFAGFRLHAPLNNPDVFDELDRCSKEPATGARSGKSQKYGISSRGIAVDTGAEGVQEEFPNFREFWLRKPEAEPHPGGRLRPARRAVLLRCLSVQDQPRQHHARRCARRALRPQGGAAARHRADVEHVLVRRELAPAFR